MKTSFNYYVTYMFTINGNSGVGSCKVTRKNELDNYEDIFGLSDKIKSENNFDSVIILNWRNIKK